MHKKNEISGIGTHWKSASSKGRLDNLVLILKLFTIIPYTLYLIPYTYRLVQDLIKTIT